MEPARAKNTCLFAGPGLARALLTQGSMAPHTQRPQVLVVDHDDVSRAATEQYLRSTARWRVRSLRSVREALAMLGTRVFDAILVNLSADGTTPRGGLRVVEVARAARPYVKIVVVGEHDEADEAIDGVHRLASAYLAKPQPMSAIESALRGVAIP